MKIIVLVEDGDDVDLANQIAEDIPHETYSVTGVPVVIQHG